MQSLIQREPVVVINTITAIIETGIALAVAFGLALSPAQVGAIMAFVVAVATLVRALLVRPRVTPLADPKDDQGNPLQPVQLRGLEAAGTMTATPAGSA